ncbi:MAG: His/Gly/Thr/Pro-type tRNA ligase C-terminal domain-containing protein [Candidatus Saccharibacteria bacterium]|nr:His/Gly/Thr/Pro-type tRNA ligase C-terminal domain-containing protein [Candidatus Saccharibacteria bacterium]
MRVSKLFTKTSKNIPAGEIAKNAQLLIRAGFISKVMSGVYVYSPLGLRVLEKIKQIIREEMDAVGGQELIMSSLQKKETWDITGRWDDKVVDMWFKSKLKDGTDVGFAWSHEEAIIEMLKDYLASYKDLPINVYQFQTKFRNELRSKSGIMRGREFVMKDMYSCSKDEQQHTQFYNDTIDAYNRVFERLGLKDDTYMTFASGGAFTQFSHEFQTICDAGEDTIYLHRGKNIAINEDVMDDENLSKLGINRDELEKVKTAEVGNIFNFGTKKSEDTDFSFTDSDGTKKFVYFGSYGIGVTRLMGVMVEKFSDEKGLVWPENISPYKIYLLRIGGDEATTHADGLYKELTDKGFEVLYDDRDIHPGQKFADSELIGIPYRVTVSDRMLENNQYELVERKNGEKIVLTREQLLAKLG